MKKFILSMTMLVLVLCLKANVSNAAEISAMERLDYWDVSKNIRLPIRMQPIMLIYRKIKKKAGFLKQM